MGTIGETLRPRLEAHPGQSGIRLHTSALGAFAARALSARAACDTLDLQYYRWHADLTGGLLIREVLKAADRGVIVRLILDDINAHGEDASLRSLDQHPNIQVRMFNPGRWRTGVGRALELVVRGISLNRRMHNKAWIVDGQLAVVGGRNIGDVYFEASGAANFADTDVSIVGPAVAEANALFNEYWESPIVVPIAELVAHRGTGTIDALRLKVEGHVTSAEAKHYTQLIADNSTAGKTEWLPPTHWSDEVHIRGDPPIKHADQGQKGWLIHSLQKSLAGAQERVEIISPYFVPGHAGVDACAQLRHRGVEMAVLTNSLAATDVVVVHSAYSDYRVPLLQLGVELYEFMPVQKRHASLLGSSRASLHTKAFTVDDDHGFVGSFNFDPRSADHNTEMGVFFHSPGLVAELRAAFKVRTGPTSSYKLSLDNGDLRWRDGSGTTPEIWTVEPKASLWTRAQTQVVGWLPLEAQL